MAVHSTTPYSTQSATHILAIALSQAAKAKSTQSIKSSAASLQPTADGRSRPCCPPEQPTLALMPCCSILSLSACQSLGLSSCRLVGLVDHHPHSIIVAHTYEEDLPHRGKMGGFDSAPPGLSKSHPYSTIRAASVSGGQLSRKPNPIGLARHNVVKPLLLPSDGQQSSHVPSKA